jgi:uncharacterized membrane protein
MITPATTSDAPTPEAAAAAPSADSRNRGRIVGVDAARGLAVLGMIGAHLVFVSAFEWDAPETWFDLVNGRSAIMFGLMAGVSLTLLSERARTAGGVELLRVRISILVRALAIGAIGALLEVLDTGFPIILATYAVVFVAGAWLITVRSRTLLIAAVVAVVLAPIIVLFARNFFYFSDLPFAAPELVYVVLLSEFPAVLWIAFLMVGIVIGRLNFTSLAVHLRLAIVGVCLMIVGYGLGEAGNTLVPPDLTPDSWEQRVWGLVEQYPHSATTSEAVGSCGFALFVLALCLAACSTRIGQIVLHPLVAVGALALTTYAGHFVAITLLGTYAEYSDEYTVFLQFLVVTTVFCILWRAILGTGPLERLVAGIARRAARFPQ